MHDRFALPERVVCEKLTDEAIASHLDLGYTLALAEDVMRFDLSRPIPAPAAGKAIEYRAWDAQVVGAFFEVYAAAFRDRPGFPAWREDEWVRWLSDDPTFRPDLTWLARVGGQAAGFIAASNDESSDRVGWIVQVGVRSEWRRRGIAATLVARSLQAWAREGKESVMLHVNVNNPGARRLYESLGFFVVARRGVLRR